jgi:hypothetical protein
VEKIEMQKLRKTMLLIACALMTQNAAHAAHPLVTEDANLQTTGKQQIELNGDHWSTSRGIVDRQSDLYLRCQRSARCILFQPRTLVVTRRARRLIGRQQISVFVARKCQLGLENRSLFPDRRQDIRQ